MSYSVGAPIQYSGGGSWIIPPNPGAEPMTWSISINLVWQDPANPNGGYTVVESDAPQVDYTINPNGNYTGTYGFSNSVDGQNDSNLIAKQDSGKHTNNYFIQTIPRRKVGP